MALRRAREHGMGVQIEASLSVARAYEQYQLQEAANLSAVPASEAGAPEEQADANGGELLAGLGESGHTATHAQLLWLLEQAMKYYEEHLQRAQIAKVSHATAATCLRAHLDVSPLCCGPFCTFFSQSVLMTAYCG